MIHTLKYVFSPTATGQATLNDISQASKMFNFVIYADDTNLNTTLELVAKQLA